MTEIKGIRTGLLVAGIILLTFTSHLVAHTITLITCGTAPHARYIYSGIGLALTGTPTLYTTPAGCTLPVTPIRVADLTLLLLLAAGVVAGVVGWRWYQGGDRAFVADLNSRPGFADGAEIRRALSARAVLRRAPQLRRDLPHPRPQDVGWRVGRARGMDVYVSIEDSVALEGPPRSGKGYRVLISAILDWSGPLITTSTTNDNLTATWRMRQQRGDVAVFDPQGLSGIPNALRVSPIAGCEDPFVAMQRGAAIITGTALGTSVTNQEWAQASGVILGRLLHAAAVSNRPITDLYTWGSGPRRAREAVQILRSDGTPGWGDALEAVIAGDDKLASSMWFGVQAAVAPLAIPRIRDALTPTPSDPVFDPHRLLAGQNTLYLIGSASGTAAMGGFLGALLDDIVETARLTALASPGSRLTHPLGLILDEIVNMFRWENLPRIMADGAGRGICPLVVLQALSQAETAWSKSEADTIWAAATAKILLGGASHVDHLRDVEALIGMRRTTNQQRSWSTREAGHSTSEHQERIPVMTVDEIRRMPDTTGLLAYRNRRVVVLDLAGWDQRRDARTIQKHKTATEHDQHTTFTTPTRAAANGPAAEPMGDEASVDGWLHAATDGDRP